MADVYGVRYFLDSLLRVLHVFIHLISRNYGYDPPPILQIGDVRYGEGKSKATAAFFPCKPKGQLCCY